MSEFVLDASAALALLRKEPGWEKVEAVGTRVMSSVNVAEVGSFLARAGYNMDAVVVSVAALRLRVVDFDQRQAMEVARLRPLTLPWGLSLGDRACLALGSLRGLPILTAERSWPDAAPNHAVTPIR